MGGGASGGETGATSVVDEHGSAAGMVDVVGATARRWRRSTAAVLDVTVTSGRGGAAVRQ